MLQRVSILGTKCFYQFLPDGDLTLKAISSLIYSGFSKLMVLISKPGNFTINCMPNFKMRNSLFISFFSKFKICQICQINCDGQVDCISPILVLLHIKVNDFDIN